MFSKILKGLRKNRNVTQIQLAEALHVSPGNVGDWETGKSLPSYKALVAMAKFFNVDANYLLGITGEEPQSDDVLVLNKQEIDMLNVMRSLTYFEIDELIEIAKIKQERYSR